MTRRIRVKPIRLGETLIEMGVLTEPQLELALEHQLLSGGHLGTSLIEMGFVDEDTLGQALSRSTGAPCAPRHLLANVEPDAIRAVPKKLAEEYQAVPIKLESRSVHLAFVNPKDLAALDALRFATGRSVVAWIAPEVRIYEALERYYGIARRARYVNLDHRLNAPHPGSKARDKGAPTPAVGDVSLFASSEPETAFGYGKPWQEVANELFGNDSAETESRTSLMSLPELAERFCRSETRDELARAVLDFTAGRAERMLLMFVRANRATVWDDRGFALSDGVRSGATFDVTSEPVFRLLMGNDHYYGALPKAEEVLSFYARLGIISPAELLLIPIHVNDHLVALALADGGQKGRIAGDVGEFRKALRLFSTAVMMVALRTNLRDVAQPAMRGLGV